MDFTKLPFDPANIKEGQLIQNVYPELKRRETFCIPLSERVEDAEQDDETVLSDIIKYVILFIDPESPFWDESDFNEREKACFKYSNITKKDRAHFHISTNTAWYQEILSEYFKIIDNDEYENWVSTKLSIKHLNAYLRSGVNADNPEQSVKASLALQKDMKTLLSELKENEKRLFPKNAIIQRHIKQAVINNDAHFVGYVERYAEIAPN